MPSSWASKQTRENSSPGPKLPLFLTGLPPLCYANLKPAHCHHTELANVFLYPTMPLFLSTTEKIKFWTDYIPHPFILIYFFSTYPTFLQYKSSLPVTLVPLSGYRQHLQASGHFFQTEIPLLSSILLWIPHILWGPVFATFTSLIEWTKVPQLLQEASLRTSVHTFSFFNFFCIYSLCHSISTYYSNTWFIQHHWKRKVFIRTNFPDNLSINLGSNKAEWN